MRRAAKADANQREIVAALRAVGASVVSLHRVGAGCPDLLVGYRNRNYLLEVKDGAKAPSARKLTTEQDLFCKYWRGQIAVVASPEEAIAAITKRS